MAFFCTAGMGRIQDVFNGTLSCLLLQSYAVTGAKCKVVGIGQM